MKKSILLLLGLIAFNTTHAQDITGQWNGILEAMQLRLVMHIEKTDTGFNATLDSPDQGVKGIPVNTATFENSVLTLIMTNLNASYTGTFNENGFHGTFTQNGMKFPLDLKRESIDKPKLHRPQEPKKPYPYHSEDVTFENKEAGITLAGTLTLPQNEGKYPAVVLISGSGPQDRNEELVGHKPFLIISDHFTKKGIAVLRFDDRGFGKSTGKFDLATSVDFASDVMSAVSYLKGRKEIDTTKIGLVGHSEGGLIAPIVASKSDDLDFIVLLAGTGIRGDKLMLLQQNLIGKAMGMSEAALKKSKEINSKAFELIVATAHTNSLKMDVKNYFTNALNTIPDDELPLGFSKNEDDIDTLASIYTTPWMHYFMKHDPAKVLENVQCAVLAVNGEKDLQVPPKENLTPIKAALERGGNQNVTTIEFSGLNHLFQECQTGAPSEYSLIEQTFSPQALTQISDWVLKQVK